MKKSELIDHIVNAIDENVRTATQLTEVLEELTFANQRIEELEEKLKLVKKTTEVLVGKKNLPMNK